MIKTYRGLLADGAQEKIPLATKDGSVGYRIVKFQILPNTPGTGSDVEGVAQIFKASQSSITGTVDFSDNDLLGAAYYEDAQNLSANSSIQIIFDGEIFNQDIFITYKVLSGSQKMNYYIELEQMKLDHTQNMSATLKAIRGSAVD